MSCCGKIISDKMHMTTIEIFALRALFDSLFISAYFVSIIEPFYQRFFQRGRLTRWFVNVMESACFISEFLQITLLYWSDKTSKRSARFCRWTFTKTVWCYLMMFIIIWKCFLICLNKTILRFIVYKLSLWMWSLWFNVLYNNATNVKRLSSPSIFKDTRNPHLTRSPR